MDTMRIAAVRATNYMRIKDITIKPQADRYVVLLGGKNRQGKSSVLGALAAALGGKDEIAADPVRHGEAQAVIEVELDNGLLLSRVINPDRSTTLEVRSKLGAVKSPQGVLDKLIGGRFLDPLEFLQLKEAEQRKRLLALIDTDGAIAKIDERRAGVFNLRTEVGRKLRPAVTQLDATPEVTPGQEIDVAALVAEGNAISDRTRELNAANGEEREARLALESQQASAKRMDDAIVRLEQQLAQARADRERLNLPIAEAEVRAKNAKLKADQLADEWERMHKPRRDEINAELARAQEHNRQVATDKAAVAARARLKADVERLDAEHDRLDGELAAIDREKAAKLEAAPLPVPGLGVAADGVTFNGVPLAQASGAEQHRVALALAMAVNPQLRDIWIRDGALFDDESLAAVAELAEAKDVRVWIERVGARDPGAIIIHDGQILETTPGEVTGQPTPQGDLFA